MEVSRELQQIIDNEKAEGQKDTAKLMNYLWSNGRGEEAQKASEDESILNKLLAEFRGGLMAAK